MTPGSSREEDGPAVNARQFAARPLTVESIMAEVPEGSLEQSVLRAMLLARLTAIRSTPSTAMPTDGGGG
jgi:hypothetical protein